MSAALLGPFFCHECDEWTETSLDQDGYRSCRQCWELIRCDECGSEWTDDHECPAAPATGVECGVFLLCGNAAATTYDAGPIGVVPACARCAEKMARIAGRAS